MKTIFVILSSLALIMFVATPVLATPPVKGDCGCGKAKAAKSDCGKNKLAKACAKDCDCPKCKAKKAKGCGPDCDCAKCDCADCGADCKCDKCKGKKGKECAKDCNCPKCKGKKNK